MLFDKRSASHYFYKVTSADSRCLANDLLLVICYKECNERWLALYITALPKIQITSKLLAIYILSNEKNVTSNQNSSNK